MQCLDMNHLISKREDITYNFGEYNILHQVFFKRFKAIMKKIY